MHQHKKQQLEPSYWLFAAKHACEVKHYNYQAHLKPSFFYKKKEETRLFYRRNQALFPHKAAPYRCKKKQLFLYLRIPTSAYPHSFPHRILRQKPWRHQVNH